MEILQSIGRILSDIREKRPLIHHITNSVTINDCANIVLALGGSPIMADDPCEVEEVTAAASALVLNMGTPGSKRVDAMIAAGRIANQTGIPVVFDPVGAGFTSFRKDIADKLLKGVRPTVIRANLSEVLYLAGRSGSPRGVDSEDGGPDASEAARELAQSLNCVVALTGKTDIITDGNAVILVRNGNEYLSRLTGTGCMATSLVAAFCSVSKDSLLGAAGGVISMGIAGQLAYLQLAKGDGIGSFKVRLFDNIFNLNEDIIIKVGDIEFEN